MASGDLEYGWRNERFTLSDVRIRKHIELLEPAKDGEWEKREAPWFSSSFNKKPEGENEGWKAFENVEQLKYSRPTRVLTAKAAYEEGSWDAMFLGVPEDKRSVPNDHESRLREFIVNISEDASSPLVELKKYDRIFYSTPSTEFSYDDGVYASLHVPSQVFDDIERITRRGNSEFQIEMIVKTWYYIGGMADSQLYIDTEEKTPAQLVGVSVAEGFGSSTPKRHLDDFIDTREPVDTQDVQLLLLQKLEEMRKLLVPIGFATSVVMAGVIAAAIKFW